MSYFELVPPGFAEHTEGSIAKTAINGIVILGTPEQSAFGSHFVLSLMVMENGKGGRRLSVADSAAVGLTTNDLDELIAALVQARLAAAELLEKGRA